MVPSVCRILSFVFLWSHVAAENDRNFKLCGTWTPSAQKPELVSRVTPGCDGLTISANVSTLSVHGSITAQCSAHQNQILKFSREGVPIHFCVLWEPLLDMLTVQVNGETFTVCRSQGVQESCCTDLSAAGQNSSTRHGIENATVHGDLLSSHSMAEYKFKGESINCAKTFCDEAVLKSSGVNMIEDTVMRSGILGRVELPCVQSTVIEMKEDFAGHNVTLLGPRSVPPNLIPSVQLPPGLKPAQRRKARVVCTYYKNSTFFQMRSKKILEDVVGISVENAIITNLVEPVRITFRHSGILEAQTTKCVSWDTRRDHDLQWREEGCMTIHHSVEETQCCCNHLTYFAVLVQMKPRPLRHLEALTFITAVGCAVSAVSCVVLFVSLCKKRAPRTGRNHLSLVHRGLVLALFFLCLFFVLTGTVANVGHERVCQCMGALLHYVLLSSLCWMAIEVLHTFWMVYKIFSLPPNPWIWYLMGFGFPALPVVALASMGNIYGQRIITQSDGVANPYRMCWMLDSHVAYLAHCITNVGFLAVVVSAGFIMLFLVIREIHNRPEWEKKRVAFLSIWGLSCLFGTTWALTFFDFGPLSEIVLFLFCIINSLQGFFLMLRFYALERLQKRSEHGSDSTSTASTRQQILLNPEKS